MSTHQFNRSKNDSNNKNKENFKKKENERQSEDLGDDSLPLSFVQLEGKCYCCDKLGHISPDCYSKNKILREEWAINKTQMVSIKNDEGTPVATSVNDKEDKEDTKHIGWARVDAMFTHNKP